MLIFINITLSSFLEKNIFKEITPRDDVFDSSIVKLITLIVIMRQRKTSGVK